MKKIVTLLCAVALVAGANAQVKQAKSVGAPAVVKEKTDISPLVMDPVAGAAKAGRVDTISTQPMQEVSEVLGGSFYAGYSCTGIPRGADGKPNWDVIGSCDAVWFTMGSGWLNHIYGSGEIGYWFDFTPTGWYCLNYEMPYYSYGITGAMTLVGRAKSTVDSMNSLRMPLRFKLYTEPMGQVTKQSAYTDIVNPEVTDEIEVFYPADPDNFVSYSDTVGIPVFTPKEGQRFGSAWVGAKFETPAVAGVNPCISVIFPVKNDGTDTLWNATLYTVSYEQDEAKSGYMGAMYTVWDFQNQNMWTYNVSEQHPEEGELVRERINGFIPDSNAQPNKRYGVVPTMSWVWQNDGSHMDGEIAMHVILAEGVTIERGASYDKYVEVKINPAIDYTVINATDRINKVEIYNLSGKLVKTQACNSHRENISLSGLSSGMYIAKVTTDAGVANKKIMVR
ncbi:MAG: T9SS type A sorting domain-containing protein [Bacteroides sp.]|nr:T9SS type A sorting domain-containing protein [Ruminococcus flavefaciens]MCM1555557.1 T9SS type A sorting domain-containing protein [Bacteroides sp.]